MSSPHNDSDLPPRKRKVSQEQHSKAFNGEEKDNVNVDEEEKDNGVKQEQMQKE